MIFIWIDAFSLYPLVHRHWLPHRFRDFNNNRVASLFFPHSYWNFCIYRWQSREQAGKSSNLDYVLLHSSSQYENAHCVWYDYIISLKPLYSINRPKRNEYSTFLCSNLIRYIYEFIELFMCSWYCISNKTFRMKTFIHSFIDDREK